MNEITKAPKAVIEAYEEKGLDSSKIQLCVKLDMNRDGVFCDNWVFATIDELIILGGSIQTRPVKNSVFSSMPKTVEIFKELSYFCISLNDIEDFFLEEMKSICRFTAKKEDGSYTLISKLSFESKNDLLLFIKYIKRLKETGDCTLDAEDNDSKCFCPKCGSRYVDIARRICPKCTGKRKVIARTAKLFFKYKWYIVAMLALMVVGSLLSVLSPYVSSAFFYDQVLDEKGKYFGQILLVIGIIVGTRLLMVANNIINGIVTARVNNYVVFDLRNTIFAATQKLSLSFFTNRQTGGIMNQVNSDADDLYSFFCYGLPRFLIYVVQVVCMVIIMLKINWIMTVVCVVVMPFVVMILQYMYTKLRNLRIKHYVSASKTNSLLSDVFFGVRVVKAFSKENDEITRFNKASQRMADANEEMTSFTAIINPIAGLPLIICSVFVWGIGGWFVMNGEMTYGILATFIAYMAMFQDPIHMFNRIIGWAANSISALERMFAVMDNIPEVEEAENPIHLEHMEGKVEFNHVSFSYVKNKKAINDVSFNIEPGQMLGIVGHTGAGKSTLANLLGRLYEVEEGEILIDGINIKNLAFSDLRKNIAIVSQETYLFAGTIFENIKYACPDATKEDVIHAAKIAGAHDFIIKLPNGYLTMVGTGYQSLSGGERQRVSIARAILMNPKILILDEATASMDTQTERKIQTAIEKLVEGRTTISIAHRLSTLRNADKLIVIENGEMPESGTPLELIKKKGIYYKLYTLQMEAMRDAGIEE